VRLTHDVMMEDVDVLEEFTIKGWVTPLSIDATLCSDLVREIDDLLVIRTRDRNGGHSVLLTGVQLASEARPTGCSWRNGGQRDEHCTGGRDTLQGHAR